MWLPTFRGEIRGWRSGHSEKQSSKHARVDGKILDLFEGLFPTLLHGFESKLQEVRGQNGPSKHTVSDDGFSE